MRGVTIAVLVPLAGCANVLGLGDPVPAIDAAPRASCVVGGLDVCGTVDARGPIAFTRDTLIDTAVDCTLAPYDPVAGSLCVIYGTDVLVGPEAKVTATGPRPLVLAASGAVTVLGTLDVGSHHDQVAFTTLDGPGANPRACAAPRPVEFAGNAGGSHGGQGGAGGKSTQGTAVKAGGVPSPALGATMTPRGGCRGGGYQDPLFAGAGSGGGAVLLLAAGAVTVEAGAVISAGGAGARDASAGGGAGGYIGLSAPTVTVRGLLAANGGGGGGGNYVASAYDGADGAASDHPAAGGSGGSGNGAGGAGAAGAVLTGGAGGSGVASSTSDGLGGGGGGGAGVIVLAGPAVDATGAVLSPAPTVPVGP